MCNGTDRERKGNGNERRRRPLINLEYWVNALFFYDHISISAGNSQTFLLLFALPFFDSIRCKASLLRGARSAERESRLRIDEIVYSRNREELNSMFGSAWGFGRSSSEGRRGECGSRE